MNSENNIEDGQQGDQVQESEQRSFGQRTPITTVRRSAPTVVQHDSVIEGNPNSPHGVGFVSMDLSPAQATHM